MWNVVFEQFGKLIERQRKSLRKNINFFDLCCFLRIFIIVLSINERSNEDEKCKQGNYNVNSETSS